MSDPLEEASALEQLERESILAAHRNRTQETPDEEDGHRYCLDCGDEIPPARIEAVNAVRCIVCAGHREKSRFLR